MCVGVGVLCPCSLNDKVTEEVVYELLRASKPAAKRTENLRPAQLNEDPVTLFVCKTQPDQFVYSFIQAQPKKKTTKKHFTLSEALCSPQKVQTMRVSAQGSGALMWV